MHAGMKDILAKSEPEMYIFLKIVVVFDEDMSFSI
jgi:hypothetical protein